MARLGWGTRHWPIACRCSYSHSDFYSFILSLTLFLSICLARLLAVLFRMFLLSSSDPSTANNRNASICPRNARNARIVAGIKVYGAEAAARMTSGRQNEHLTIAQYARISIGTDQFPVAIELALCSLIVPIQCIISKCVCLFFPSLEKPASEKKMLSR